MKTWPRPDDVSTWPQGNEPLLDEKAVVVACKVFAAEQFLAESPTIGDLFYKVDLLWPRYEREVRTILTAYLNSAGTTKE